MPNIIIISFFSVLILILIVMFNADVYKCVYNVHHQRLFTHV